MSGRPDVIWLDEVDSTNRFALENFDALPDGSMIAALRQSAGRGSKGRQWISPPDVNIYASMVLKGFDFTVPQAAWIGSLAVLEVLRTHAPRLDFRVKWPNDVLCGKKKIAGILCESRYGRSGGIVIGAGVNINMDPASLREIGRPATSLYAETGILADDVGSFALEIQKEALKLYADARKEGGIANLHRLWSAENILAGKNISIRLHNGSILTGLVVDFSGNGALILINHADSRICEIPDGEVLSMTLPASS